MNVVDSSGWLEYFAGSSRAELFAAAIEDKPSLIVPVISIYEIVKKVLRERGESDALRAIDAMKCGKAADLDLELAERAARYQLPLADSIIYATAVVWGATLWTQDEHFKGMPQVQYFSK